MENKDLDLKLKFILSCRLCGEIVKNSALIPIHESLDDDESPPSVLILNCIPSFEFSENDNLPQQVCQMCYKKILCMNTYIEKVFEAQKMLKKFFNNKKDLIQKFKEESEEVGNFGEISNEWDVKEEDMSDIQDKEENMDTDFYDKDSSDEYFNDDFKEDFRFICHLCKKDMKSAARLDSHITISHSIQGEDDRLCEHCGEILKKREFYLHMKQIWPRKKLDCYICEKEFLCRGNLRIHNRVVHANSKEKCFDRYEFQCVQCNFKFKTMVKLERHKLSHHSNKREQCSRYKPVTCEYCKKTFGRPDHLKSHVLRIHLKKFDFICRYCKKAFSEKSNLTFHIKKNHSDMHFYKCNKCYKSYLSKEMYDKHMLKHEIPTYACVFCDKKFFKNYQLTNHEEREHDKELQQSIIKV